MNFFKKSLKLLISWLVLCFCLWPNNYLLASHVIKEDAPLNIIEATGSQTKHVVKIGILENWSQSKNAKESWDETAVYLKEHLPAYDFEIVSLSFDNIYNSVSGEKIDFVFTNPSIYVELETLYGASRIATVRNIYLGQESVDFGGVIFAKKDRNDITSLRDLKGKKVGAVEKNSFGGWQVVEKELYDNNIYSEDFKSLKFIGGHSQTVKAVLNNEVDIGIARTGTLEGMAMTKEINIDDFKIINDFTNVRGHHKFGFLLKHSTNLYPEWPLAKLKNTSDELSRKVAGVLYEMTPELPSAKNAGIAGWTTPLNYQPVHELLKSLKLSPYQKYGEITAKEIFNKYLWEIIVGLFFLVILVLSLLLALYLYRKNKNSLYFIEAIFEAIPSPLFYKDTKGRYQGCNSAFLDGISKFSKKDLIGKTVYDIVSSKKLADRHFAEDKELIKNHGTKIYDSELTYKDGTNRQVRLYKSAYENSNGEVVGVVGVISDLSDEKKKELDILQKNSELAEQKKVILKSLKEMEEQRVESIRLAHEMEKFKMAVDSVSDHIVITDKEGIVLYGNKAVEKITGYTVEESSGKKAGTLWRLPMPKDFYVNLWKTIKTDKKVFEGEIQNRRKNGQIYDARISIYPVLDEKKEILFFIGVESDISQAKEIDRMKTEFVSVASHQLRTPLTGIKWFTELIMSDDKKNLLPDQHDFLKQIYESNERMIRLVNDLLNVSRIDTGRKFSIEKQKADIIDLVKKVAREQLIVAQIKNINIKVDDNLPSELFLKIDFEKVIQALSNLVNNAVKYSQPGQEVEIGFEKKSDSFVFFVRDHGCGIPKAHQGRIFEKFFRAENAVRLDAGGTGLGLYIVKAIIEGHGGKVWFESEENKGTTFYISLPKK